MKQKITVTGEAPKGRNPIAASLRHFRSVTERKAKGRGSYRRDKRVRDEGSSPSVH